MEIRPLAREEVRSIDREAAGRFGLPTLVLMENAGRGAAALIADVIGGDRRPVTVLCGPGNNGGDGGVVARWLDLWGHPARVVWFAEADRLAPDAAVQRGILEKAGVPQECRPDGLGREELARLLSGSSWVVDGLLGTGLSRPVEGPMATAIGAVNASGRPVLALDLPSGMDADTGRPLGGLAVRATVTATFVAPKLGFGHPEAAGYLGRVEVIEIGAPRALLERYAIGREG